MFNYAQGVAFPFLPFAVPHLFTKVRRIDICNDKFQYECHLKEYLYVTM
jgi:hypothetical protein